MMPPISGWLLWLLKQPECSPCRCSLRSNFSIMRSDIKNLHVPSDDDNSQSTTTYKVSAYFGNLAGVGKTIQAPAINLEHHLINPQIQLGVTFSHKDVKCQSVSRLMEYATCRNNSGNNISWACSPHRWSFAMGLSLTSALHLPNHPRMQFTAPCHQFGALELITLYAAGRLVPWLLSPLTAIRFSICLVFRPYEWRIREVS